MQFSLTDVQKRVLAKPSSMLSIFPPEERKLMMLAEKLMLSDMFVEDKQRDFGYIHKILFPFYFSGVSMTLIYEIGDFEGIIGFVDIQPWYKCSLVFKAWDKHSYGPDAVRELKELILLIMKLFYLERINLITGDKRGVKMGKLVGMTLDFVRENDFKVNGKIIPAHYLSIEKEV